MPLNLLDLSLPVHAEERLLVDVVVVLSVGVLLAMLSRRLGQSPVIGYLIAGIALGPGAFGVVTQVDAFPIIGEVGIALLLFTVGLELSWTSVRHTSALPWRSASLQVGVTLAAFTLVALAIGVEQRTAIVVGMLAALSSTAVVLRVLAERAEVDSFHGRTALAILLVQDIIAVAFLLLVPMLADDATANVALALLVAMVKLGGVIAVMVALDRLVVRRLFHHASSASERELLVVLSLAVALGAAGATDVLGLSPMVGAFIAGLLIGDAAYSDQVHAEIGPLRTGLIVLFFAFVGMTVDTGWVLENWPLVIAALACVVTLKVAATTAALRFMGTGWRLSVLTGVVVCQLGEFSLVIATAATQAGLLDHQSQQLVISTVFLSILATPAAIQVSTRWAYRSDVGVGSTSAGREKGHAIIVGHGPSGAEVVRSMRDLGLPIVVIELNPDLAPDHQDVRFAQGDAGRVEVLHAADVDTAALLVVSIPDPIGAARVTRQARSLAPALPVLVRGRYHRYISRLIEAGATDVVDEELDVGFELARRATQLLGDASTST